MGEPRGVAVVGLGIGRAHVQALRRLRDRFQIVAVCDANEAAATEVAERIHCDTGTFDEILARDDVEIVAICTPPFLHRQQVEAVLAAGKHCVCEKPLVGSLADCDALATLEAGARTSVMPVFNYRYGQGLQKLLALVEAGVAGRPYAAHMDLAWRRREEYYAVPWRGAWATELGGVLVSHAVHGLDALLQVLGPPARVFARASTLVNQIETDDTSVAILEHPDGALVTLNLTLGSPAEMSRQRYAFANLAAESGTDPYAFTDDPWTFAGDTPEATAAIESVLDGFEARPDGWIGQYHRYADALDAGSPPPVTVADARAALELVTALYTSSREGRAVELPFPSDHPAYEGWQP